MHLLLHFLYFIIVLSRWSSGQSRRYFAYKVDHFLTSWVRLPPEENWYFQFNLGPVDLNRTIGPKILKN